MSILKPIPLANAYQRPLTVPLGSHFGVVDQWHPTPHRGVDFPAVEGANINAIGWGRVIAVYPESVSPVLGLVTVIGSKLRKDKAGRNRIVYHGYCHQSRVLVKEGDKVRKGQHIGAVGATGTAARGSHLHLTTSYQPLGVFQCDWNDLFDPILFIEQHRS